MPRRSTTPPSPRRARRSPPRSEPSSSPYVAPGRGESGGAPRPGPTTDSGSRSPETLKHLVPIELGSHEKVTNVTGSAPYAERLSIEQTRDDGIHLQARLGKQRSSRPAPADGQRRARGGEEPRRREARAHRLRARSRRSRSTVLALSPRGAARRSRLPVLLTGPSGRGRARHARGRPPSSSRWPTGQSARISGIPAGTSFSVSEHPRAGLLSHDNGRAGGRRVIPPATTRRRARSRSEPPRQRFTNTKQVGDARRGARPWRATPRDQARGLPL